MKNVNVSFKNKVLIPIVVIFITAVFVISAYNYNLLYTSVRIKANSVLDMFTSEILTQINHLEMILETTEKTLNQNHLAIARLVADILDKEESDMSAEGLSRFCATLGITELCVTDAEGTIIHSNIPEYIGFNYGSNEKTKKYMDLANGKITELQEEPRESEVRVPEVGEFSHYTGISRKGGGFYQIGYDAGVILWFQDKIDIKTIIKETKLGENGFGMVLYGGVINAHPNDDLLGISVSDESWYKEINKGSGFTRLIFDSIPYYAGYRNEGNYTVIGLIPENEYHKETNQLLVVTVLSVLTASVIITIVLYVIISRLLRPVKSLAYSLNEIAKGNFNVKIEDHYSDEFSLIKNAVNFMVDSIISYVNDKMNTERLMHEAELTRLDLLIKVHYDALTSLYNRRYLDETFGHSISLLSRSGGSFSVLMIDIDYFKQFNDMYGHNEGDMCLKMVAQALQGSVERESDFVARYGGEEFSVILPNTDEEGAKLIAEKIMKSVNSLKIKHENSKVSEYVTISIGITTGKVTHSQTGDDYLKRADEALYMSKQSGRNRYTFLPMDTNYSQQ